jgi:flagellar basal-body rod protein FlgG
MNRALYAAASGMTAQQRNLDVVADNLANADVPGFKASVLTFSAIGTGADLGTAETGSRSVFSQGKLAASGGPFDIAIDGTGLFQVERDGERAYTRGGSFGRTPDGSVEDADGWHLLGVHIPADATAVHVGTDGHVIIDAPDSKNLDAGRIRLVAFNDPGRLRPIGSARFAATAESGPAHALRAGGEAEPKIMFGMLEKSNVSIIEAMMQILAAQRAYEANSKGVQAADEMLRIANNIHR